jgi:hypothetical protein
MSIEGKHSAIMQIVQYTMYNFVTIGGAMSIQRQSCAGGGTLWVFLLPWLGVYVCVR